MKNIIEFEKAIDSAISCVKEKGWHIEEGLWIEAGIDYEDENNPYLPTDFEGVGACCPIGAYFVCERPKEALILADGNADYVELAAKILRVSTAKIKSFIAGFDSISSIAAERKQTKAPSYYDLGRKFRTKYCG